MGICTLLVDSMRMGCSGSASSHLISDVDFDSWVDILEDGLRDLFLHLHYGLTLGA